MRLPSTANQFGHRQVSYAAVLSRGIIRAQTTRKGERIAPAPTTSGVAPAPESAFPFSKSRADGGARLRPALSRPTCGTYFAPLPGKALFGRRCLMPEKQTIERARQDKREGKAPTTQA